MNYERRWELRRVEENDSWAEGYRRKNEGKENEEKEARTRGADGHEGGKVKRETVGAQEGLGREEEEMEKKKKKKEGQSGRPSLRNVN